MVISRYNGSSSVSSKPHKKWRHRFLVLVLLASVLAAFAGVTAYFGLRGRPAARLVSAVLADVLPGSLKLDRVSWDASLIADVFAGGKTAFVLEGIHLKDPEGVDVLRVPRLEFSIAIPDALNLEIRLHDVRISPDSYWRFASMQAVDEIGFLAALIAAETNDEPADDERPLASTEAGATAKQADGSHESAKPDAAAGSAFVLELVHADLRGLTVEFDFPGAWGLQLKDLLGEANFIIEGDFLGFDAWDLHAPDGGYLDVLSERLPFDEVHVDRVATLREYRNDIFLDLGGARTGKSLLVGKGYFTHIYDAAPPGIDMRAAFRNAADALDAVASAHEAALGPLQIRGDNAALTLELSEPFARIAIKGKAENLDVVYGQAEARRLGFDLLFTADPMMARLEPLRFEDPKGGEAILGVIFADTPATPGESSSSSLDVTLGLKSFRTDSYIPEGLREMLAGVTGGRLQAHWDLLANRGNLSIPGLTLRRRFEGGLPPRIKISGRADASMLGLDTKGLRIEVPGASAEAKGSIKLAEQALSLTLKAVAGDVGLALEPLGLPPVAKRGRLDVHVGGSFSNPRVRGQLRAQDLGLAGGPRAQSAKARFSLINGLAQLQELDVRALGGRVQAAGRARLFRRDINQMISNPALALSVDGRDLDLGEFISESLFAGRLTFSVRARGRVPHLHGTVEMPPNAHLAILGQQWSVSKLLIDVRDGHATLSTTELTRGDGGVVSLAGSVAFAPPHEMSWHIKLRDIPLAAVPELDATALALEGFVDTDLTVAGTPAWPSLDGKLLVRALSVDGIALGDSSVLFESQRQRSSGPYSILATGQLVDAIELNSTTVLTDAGPRVRAHLAFAELSAEDYIPALTRDLSSSVTGGVTLNLEPGKPLAIDLEVSDFAASVQTPAGELAGFGQVSGAGATRENGGEQPNILDPSKRRATTDKETPQTVELRNQGPIVVRLRGDRIELEKSRLSTTGGDLDFGGTLSGQSVLGAVRGHLDLDVLAPVVRRLDGRVRDLTGGLVLGLRLDGTLDKPRAQGTLAITRGIALSHSAFAAGPIRIPSAVVQLEPTRLALKDLIVEAAGSRLELTGESVFSPAYELQRFSFDASGGLDAGVLSVLTPSVVTESSGVLQLTGHVGGEVGATPDFDATLEAENVLLVLRDPEHRLEVGSGTISVEPSQILIEDFRAVVDDRGEISIGAGGFAPGRIELAPDPEGPLPRVAFAEIPIRGEHLAYRVPGTFEIDDLGMDLVLTGDLQTDVSLTGDVRVVTGRVLWDFEVGDLVLSPRLVEGGAGPARPRAAAGIGAGPQTIQQTLSETAKLDLTVRTIGDTFLVQNNIVPEMFMQIDVHVGGTPRNPEISGGLRPTDGRFHIIGLRGDFNLVQDANFITFEPSKSLAELETPWLNLEAENLVTDTGGNEHVVFMRVTGPVGQANLEFSSDTGLTQNQSLLLLLSGNAATSTGRFSGSEATLTQNVNQSLNIAGQATRDFLSTLIEPYIDNTLSLLTGDTLSLRPTIGPDGLEVRLFGRFNRRRAGRFLGGARALRLQLNYLQGFQNQRQANLDARLWIADYFTLRSAGEYLQLAPQQGISETFASARLELFFDFPMRWPRP